MAYLAPDFEYDVFVSYSHGDPSSTGDSPLKRWTLSLVGELRAEIKSVDTEFDQLHIWLDDQIDPTAALTRELRDAVKSSGILMIVMSPRYLASSWCKDELEWFREQVRSRSSEQGRVFVVRALATDEQEWPDFLRDERGNSLIGFRFHDPQSKMPYGWGGVRNNSEEYVRQLWTLQTALNKRLRQLREHYKNRPKPATIEPPDAGPANPQVADAQAAFFQPATLFQSPPTAPHPATRTNGRKRVYVHSSGNNDPARNEVQRSLSQLNIIPLSAAITVGDTLTAWRLEARARFETAKRCHALALVRADANEGFIGDLLEIGVDERERIQAARGIPLPCAVLDQSGVPLPIDVSPFGIKRFDMGRENWQADFSAWFEDAAGRA